ncbi:MAG: kelch repeat-containing protein [Planctomycetota bacterium]
MHALSLSSFVIVALAGLLLMASNGSAQHFAKPADIDPSEAGVIGAPAFTIARATTSFGAVAHDGWLYVMGGYTGRPHDYYHEGQSRDFYRVNLLDPTHVESLPDTRGLQACPLEAFEGDIIVVGGMVALNSRGEDQSLLSIDTAQMFDPTRNAWQELPALPAGRSSHDTAIIESHLYVAGGWRLKTEEGAREWASDVLRLDLRDTSAGWESIEAPFQRRALASVAAGGKLVVIGGLSSEGRMSSGVDVYDPATGAWTTGPDYPGISFGVGAVAVDGRVIASGSDGVVYAWDPASDDQWDAIGAMTFPRFFHQMTADDDGNVYTIGGTARGIRPVHVERFPTRTASEPAGVVAHWTVPSPGVAKNRQGVFIEDGWLYLFGGNNSTGQHDFEPHNFVDQGLRLSLSGLTWRDLDSLPAPRQSLDLARSGDGARVLAVGGFAHDGEVARTFDDGFVYDIKERAWSELGTVLPVPRSQFDLVQHDGDFYIFGGLDYDSRRAEGDHFRHVTPVLVGREGEGGMVFEESGVDLPRPRRAFGGATMDGKHYLIGGMRENFTPVEACDVYDFASKTFSEITPPAKPRLSPSVVALGGKLYIAGGSSPKAEGGFEPNPSIEVYDPATGSWSTVMDEIPISPRHMRMLPDRGRLLLVSTHTDEADQIDLVLVSTGG